MGIFCGRDLERRIRPSVTSKWPGSGTVDRPGVPMVPTDDVDVKERNDDEAHA
jgi:hypothetical protein